MNCFNKILIFLGLKQKNTGIQVRKKIKRGLSFNVERNRIKEPVLNRISQPRTITRGLYTHKKNRNLSPKLKHYRNNSDEISINVEELEESTKSNLQIIKNFFSQWWYSLLITGLFTVQPIYNIIYFDIKGLPSLFFQISIFIQYILLVNYFTNIHYEKYVKSDKISYWILGLSIVSVIYNCIGLFILEDNIEMNNFNNQPIFCKIFMYVTLPLIWFYGKMIIFVHTFVFSSVLCDHTQELKHYSEEVTTDQLFEEGNLNIFKISESLTKIRYTMEQSIELFSSLFSFSTIMFALAWSTITYLIRNEISYRAPWETLLIYSINHFIFLFNIYNFSNSKKSLLTYIKGPRFLFKHFSRYTYEQIQKKFEDINMIMINLQEENSASIEWISLYLVLNEKWLEFSVLGISFENFEVFKKTIAAVILIFSVWNFFQ